jgi:hypothetical protein
MIENATNLRVAIRNLRILEKTLKGLREELREKNPWLLGITEKAYIQRIESIQKDVVQYLADHPADLSQVMAPPESVLAEPSTPATSAVG